jgi:hypothetical protein
MLTRKVVLTVVLGLCVLTGLLSPAEAVITIKSAGVVNGAALVDGRTAADATISWEGAAVTQANRKGNFAFQGVIPSDCVGTLSDGTATIEVALANCAASEPVGQLRKTGQTTCWDSSGAQIACAGTGQDGDLQAGAPRSYTDNGDGTITDNVTGLMWEKLVADGSSIHAVGRLFTWAGAFAQIATLNAMNFAGHNDWRLPNVNELQSLIDYGRLQPSIDPVFNDPAADSFTAFNLNVTSVGAPAYWTSTTPPLAPLFALAVEFTNGAIFFNNSSDKPDGLCVRAVRGR